MMNKQLSLGDDGSHDGCVGSIEDDKEQEKDDDDDFVFDDDIDADRDMSQ